MNGATTESKVEEQKRSKKSRHQKKQGRRGSPNIRILTVTKRDLTKEAGARRRRKQTFHYHEHNNRENERPSHKYKLEN